MSGRLAGDVPAGYVIRQRQAGDDALLVRIENRAAQLFRHHGHPDIAADPIAAIEDFRAIIGANRVWVAATSGDGPVGFAVAGKLGDYVHLRELSVDPAHGRRGIGTALVRMVIAAATDTGAAGVSLTTFRSVPFNQPFYETLGFRELSLTIAPTTLEAAFRSELPPGVTASERVLMVKGLRDSA